MNQSNKTLNLKKGVFAALAVFLLMLFGSAAESFAQRQPQGARTPIA